MFSILISACFVLIVGSTTSPARPKRVAIYARVSTNHQTASYQITCLREVADRHGWQVIAEYLDRGISGAKSRAERPQFNALLKAVARREVELITAWSVDRLECSLTHLLSFLEGLSAWHVDLYLHKQGLDTSTATDRALFQMYAVFAEFERTMIRERVTAGLARARKQDTRSGKPTGRPRNCSTRTAPGHITQASGTGLPRIGRELRIGTWTVQRIIAERG
jgi:DNA invertase Pin-like site-specific DNA recombinase